MKLYRCAVCANTLYFENRVCSVCGHRLGYEPESDALVALEERENGAWAVVGSPEPQRHFCTNADADVCNWLTTEGSGETFCLACRHNRTIPNVATPQNLLAWRELELAKHRLFYSLLRWRLPLNTRNEDPAHGLAFEFLAEAPDPSGPKVLTGHDEGLITISLAEADNIERERRRLLMHEPYRTLLGHFRHEIGHYFWDVLVRNGPMLEECRATFGDDRADYTAALQQHYQNGPPADWPDNFVSAYATTHPWEDFAETWAHYLHIVDTLETAGAFGLSVNPRVSGGTLSAAVDFDPYVAGSVEDITKAWIPIVSALNNINRSMGQTDLYPFVLSPTVMAKLGFIHRLIRERM